MKQDFNRSWLEVKEKLDLFNYLIKMKVKELIEELKKCEEDSEVIIELFDDHDTVEVVQEVYKDRIVILR